jgi:glycosyltransferase involved in cell wall biosynthesis
MKDVIFSIGIPMYNAEKFIANVFNLVLNQSYRNQMILDKENLNNFT